MAQLIPAHALREHKADAVFGITAKAEEAIKKYSKDKIINSTIGTLLDDEGNIVAFKSVYDVYRNLPDKLLAGYAAIEGDKEFLAAVPSACFGDYRPEGYLSAVATPGGTGAIRHSIYNFTSAGECFISPDWYWPAYGNIATEYLREFVPFEMFDSNDNFNLNAMKAAFAGCIEKQHRVVMVINSPSNNPTGYSLSEDEWDEVIEVARFYAKDKQNSIILLIDIAYIDFACEGSRAFMRKFSSLSENILVLFAFSQSKSMTMYGLRSGALIAVSSKKEVCEDFFYTCKFSNRATWSNGAKGAMQTLATIYSDGELLKQYKNELSFYRDMLKTRATAFLNRAEEFMLPMTPYRDGYFVSIKSDEPQRLCDMLCEENLFTVPFTKGVRVALCSISEKKCGIVADIVAKTLKKCK